MKSTPPLHAVMLTIMFFLCSTLLFTKVSPEEFPTTTGPKSSSGPPLDEKQMSNVVPLDEQMENVLQNSASGHKPDPMFSAMFMGGDLSQILEAKIKDYEHKKEHVKSNSMANDVSTTRKIVATESGKTIGTGANNATTPSGSTNVVVGSTAQVKQPRSLVYRWVFGIVSGVLFLLICMLLCWEQCCQSPHY